MILGTSLKHGGYYFYKIHKPKLERLNPHENLKKFLLEMLENCPDENFEKGPRSSILKFDLKPNLKQTKHPVNYLARIGLESDYYGNAHLNVQMFMLAYDKNTVAIEVPLWLKPEELQNYQEFFNSNLPLSGHIDALSIDEGKIWIWDYKPNAHREKYATTQTFFYALMLSKRTGIPLKNFMCGYFDDKNTYVFDPLSINASTLQKLNL
ncbi:MAG: PD-(D/E)XK nuclease family protein [Candidatus Woesearchaeota archaeon]